MINKIKVELIQLDKYLLTKMTDLEMLDKHELKVILSYSKSQYRTLAYKFELCDDAPDEVRQLFKEVDVKMEKIKKLLSTKKINWSSIIDLIVNAIKKFFAATEG